MNLLFQRPVSLTDAIVRLADLELLPTGSSAADIRQWSRDVRAASLFSARTTHLGYLEKIQDVAKQMASGEINIATGRALLQDELEAIGYTPEKGFQPSAISPQQPTADGSTADGTVPPADPGSLRDLSSDKRLKLVLETQTARAQNFARKVQGDDDLERFQFPAWELVREEYREHERDEMPNGVSWRDRFVRAGGTLVQDRMVALKDDDIWSSLGDSDLFPDGMDSDVPPYAFNSGMGWRAVPREECIELGLITGDETPEFTDARFFDETKLNADQFSEDFLRNLVVDLRAA